MVSLVRFPNPLACQAGTLSRCHWNILLRWHELVSLGRGQSLFRYFRTKSLQFLLSVCTVCACAVCVLWCLCYTCAVFSVHCVCLFVRVVRLYCLCVVTMVPLFPARHTITYHVSFMMCWMRQSNQRKFGLDLSKVFLASEFVDIYFA